MLALNVSKWLRTIREQTKSVLIFLESSIIRYHSDFQWLYCQVVNNGRIVVTYRLACTVWAWSELRAQRSEAAPSEIVMSHHMSGPRPPITCPAHFTCPRSVFTQFQLSSYLEAVRASAWLFEIFLPWSHGRWQWLFSSVSIAKKVVNITNAISTSIVMCDIKDLNPTVSGIWMVFKPHSRNADSSIRCSFEFDSNVTDVSDVHLSKQDLHTTSTDEGIWIVLKRLPENADSSIRCNFEFDSNVIDVSELQ
jgi:hypothetical protein